MICACVPLRVSVLLLLAPALMVAPPSRDTLSLPWSTVRRVLARLPSTSWTLRPVMARSVSSATVCAPGTVFSGASLTAVTSMLRVLSLTLVSAPLLAVPPSSWTLKPMLA